MRCSFSFCLLGNFIKRRTCFAIRALCPTVMLRLEKHPQGISECMNFWVIFAMNIQLRDTNILVDVLGIVNKNRSWLDTSLSFANIYIYLSAQPTVVCVYIHALRSVAASAVCSQYLAFCKTQGMLDMLKCRSAVPIAEIWDSLYQCSEFPAEIKIFICLLHVLGLTHRNLTKTSMVCFITLFYSRRRCVSSSMKLRDVIIVFIA